jgi:hypothetical protein|tara:strand:+ start:172 stop:360 length:189 start_codon:yes stop_codon:yes gene_type:complete
MTFEEAIIKSVKAYLDGEMPTELMGAAKETKYTPEYFDELEEELVNKPQKPKKKKKEVEDDE